MSFADKACEWYFAILRCSGFSLSSTRRRAGDSSKDASSRADTALARINVKRGDGSEVPR